MFHPARPLRLEWYTRKIRQEIQYMIGPKNRLKEEIGRRLNLEVVAVNGFLGILDLY